MVGAHDRHLAGFERLAQRVESLRLEFRQLVEEEQPWCASDISPGRACKPPPTSAGMLAE
jgi:hypothetical protein